jgi:hypothetical protein
MAFAPDPCPSSGMSVRRLFVAEQAGTVRVFRNGALQAKHFFSVACDTSGARGLDGICFDPAFATNDYVYIYYKIFQADTTVPTHNRSSRFMADPAKPDVALAGNQTPIIEMDNLSTGALISVPHSQKSHRLLNSRHALFNRYRCSNYSCRLRVCQSAG